MTMCACGRTFLCDPRDCKALRDCRRRELAEYERREAASPPLDRAKRYIRAGDKVRFCDWRQPSVLQEGEVVSPAFTLPPPRLVCVQRSGFHGVSFVALADIVEVAEGEANSKAKEV